MIPIVLCGGLGARLWPLLKKKPFYNFFKTENLMDKCLKRLEGFEPLFVVSTEELKTDLEKTLKNYKAQVIYEPVGKNTAVSIALACHLLSKNKKKEIVGIFPSDHFIEKELKFQKLLSKAIQLAKKEHKIITFGIPPSNPCSAYGHIQMESKNQNSVKKAIAFLEKPSITQSAGLIKKGALWNSGIFIAPLELLIEYFKTHLPQLWEQILNLKDNSISSTYKQLSPISFDKGIMENIKDYFCLRCDVGWHDLGSWDRIAVWDQKFPGKLNNKACAVEKDAKSNFIFSSESKSIAVIGSKNNLVINGGNGLLISKKGQSESVKQLNFEKTGWRKKPWGWDRILLKEEYFQYKQLKIEPGHQLSYQSHKHRKEHWLIVEGQAEVLINDIKKTLQSNEHIFIEKGVKHRLKNSTDSSILVLEIQVGHCFDEEDIIRYEDDYGRV